MTPPDPTTARHRRSWLAGLTDNWFKMATLVVTVLAALIGSPLLVAMITRSAATPGRQPAPSATPAPSSGVPPVASAGPDSPAPVTTIGGRQPWPGGGPATARTVAPVGPGGPGPGPGSAPQKLTATVRCSASCATADRKLPVDGALSGSLAAGHRAVVFTVDPGGMYYLGSHVSPAGGRWSGVAGIGNGQPTGPATIDYTVCLYDIDASFDDDLRRRGDAVNAGLADVPTAGTANRLACTDATWIRPVT